MSDPVSSAASELVQVTPLKFIDQFDSCEGELDIVRRRFPE
jgi:hypothetical protein